MDNNIQYTLNLKDNFTSHVREAETSVKGLEGALGGVKGMLGALGVGFAIFKGIDFVKEGVESFHRLHAAEAQVEAGLKSTGEAAGLTMSELDEMAKSLSSHLLYGRADIMEMQSVLLTFPSVTKDTFESASKAILDMSTRMGQDVKNTTIQIGKALQDPEHGITALKRVGVNFSESQKEVIKKLVETGQVAKAQGLILNELALEFGGSAQAAFDIDPLAKFNKAMGSLKMSMGDLATGLLKELTPTLEKFANILKSGFDWLKRNKDEVVVWTKAILAAVVAAKGMVIIPPILLAIENAAVAAAMGQSGFTAALTATINPTTLLVASVGALVLLYEKIELYNKNKEKYMSDVAADEEEFVKQGMERYKGQKNARELSIKDEAASIQKSIANYKSSIAEITKTQQEASKAGAYNASMIGIEDLKAYSKELEVLEARQKGLELVKKGPSNVAKQFNKKELETVKNESKAVGSKSVTINISIGKLIESFKVQTTNIGEGASKIKEKVAESLLSAINDSQVVAGI